MADEDPWLKSSNFFLRISESRLNYLETINHWTVSLGGGDAHTFLCCMVESAIALWKKACRTAHTHHLKDNRPRPSLSVWLRFVTISGPQLDLTPWRGGPASYSWADELHHTPTHQGTNTFQSCFTVLIFFRLNASKVCERHFPLESVSVGWNKHVLFLVRFTPLRSRQRHKSNICTQNMPSTHRRESQQIFH